MGFCVSDKSQKYGLASSCIASHEDRVNRDHLESPATKIAGQPSAQVKELRRANELPAITKTQDAVDKSPSEEEAVFRAKPS